MHENYYRRVNYLIDFKIAEIKPVKKVYFKMRNRENLLLSFL